MLSRRRMKLLSTFTTALQLVGCNKIYYRIVSDAIANSDCGQKVCDSKLKQILIGGICVGPTYLILPTNDIKKINIFFESFNMDPNEYIIDIQVCAKCKTLYDNFFSSLMNNPLFIKTEFKEEYKQEQKLYDCENSNYKGPYEIVDKDKHEKIALAKIYKKEDEETYKVTYKMPSTGYSTTSIGSLILFDWAIKFKELQRNPISIYNKNRLIEGDESKALFTDIFQKVLRRVGTVEEFKEHLSTVKKIVQGMATIGEKNYLGDCEAYKEALEFESVTAQGVKGSPKSVDERHLVSTPRMTGSPASRNPHMQPSLDYFPKEERRAEFGEWEPSRYGSLTPLQESEKIENPEIEAHSYGHEVSTGSERIQSEEDISAWKLDIREFVKWGSLGFIIMGIVGGVVGIVYVIGRKEEEENNSRI